MIISIGESISQIRNLSKAVKQDNIYISDRLIYSLIKKHTALLLYREDGKHDLSRYRFIYTTLPFVELVEVDTIEAECAGLRSNCIIKRTKDKLPPMLKGYSMPLIGIVSSIDGSERINQTNPLQYIRKTELSDSKYNKTKYYWYLNGYLYFPNIKWDAVKLEAVLDGESLTDCGEIDPCSYAQDISFPVPEHLLSTVQSAVLQDISFLIQAPQDLVQDKQSTES